MDESPAQLPQGLIEPFRAAFGRDPAFFVRAPGRVDLIGAHTDYNEGWVLPAAINRDVWLAVSPAEGKQITIHALDMGGQVSFGLADVQSGQDVDGNPLPDWARYAAGAAWSLQEEGLEAPGCRIVAKGEVPVGAGLSSSAAVEVAYATAWKHIGAWEIDPMKLAQICQRAENVYVGVNSGLMDQFSSLFGQAGHALLFDCRSLEWEALPLPDHVSLVVADTGTRRTLANSHYNQRRAECDEAVYVLQQAWPEISALRDVSLEQFEACQQDIPAPARWRAKHVINENVRVLAAAEALRRKDAVALGHLMDESQISARDWFDASGPELDIMWRVAHGHPARLGGRFLGAGWAGCMIFLVETEGLDDFMSHTARLYGEASENTPSLYALRAADGAQVLPVAGG